jgi:hypothetical protein
VIESFLFAVGISVLAIRLWTAKALPHWVSGLLITSTLIGILGYVIQGFDILFVISGVIFGIGFIGAGFTVWLQPVR